MKKIRSVVYLFSNVKEKCIHSTGIDFNEYVNSMCQDLNHILLLSSQYEGNDYHNGLRMDYVRKEDLDNLLKEDVYKFGEFSWIDFEELNSLDLLNPQDVSNILYLDHMKEPINTPFFETLNNKYVYLAHDDGWFNKCYVKEQNSYERLISNLIPLKLKEIHRKKTSMIRKEVGEYLFKLSTEGLLIDFKEASTSVRDFKLPVYIIGENYNFDNLINNLDFHKKKAKEKLWLVYKEKLWNIMNDNNN
ncbi:peptide ABC transporter permease [Chengkuizengella marina]|uniref:Peptide ABC transporter permease n=1 Tax=Chengkuizengella marina TaxID=2507566 RepID=A0A6N9Q025_9BACL|nr:peptide ABC transporter permease [Chengkuizengella marina]NBI28432.1 peptide ABC transporter permease [Chengkuizengella marina]